MSAIIVHPGIVLVDITAKLPKHKTRKYLKREKPISKLYFHKSGKIGAPGFRGAFNSARYCVTKRKVDKSPILGWAGMPYTFWNCHKKYTVTKADMDGLINLENGEPDLYGTELVYFRCQPDHLRTWHTGGWANQLGIAMCFQGTGNLSEWQIEIAEAHIPWTFTRHGLSLPAGLSWHSDESVHGPPKIKPVCPGPKAVKWLTDYRNNP